MPAKGLTRKITKKQAKSYELTPNARRGAKKRRARSNPMGVTAIAAVANARGSYRARYAATRAMLTKPARKSSRGGSMPGMHRRRVARRNLSARELNELFDKQMAAGARKKAAAKRRPRSKLQRTKLLKARAAAQRKRVGAKYGPYRSLKATVGSRKMPTYAVRGRGGKLKKIPLWAILGAKSKKDLERRQGEPRLARGIVATKRRRERKAAKVLLHGDLFTPNRRRRSSRVRTIPYETWSENPMKKKTAKRGRKKARSPAQIRATKRMIAARRASLRGGAAPKKRHTKGKRTVARKAAPKHRVGKRTRTAAQRRATARMLSKRWGKKVSARSYWKNPEAAAAAPNPRRRKTARKATRTKRRSYKARARAHGAVSRRRVLRGAAWHKARGLPTASPRRRKARKTRKAARNPMYNANRRRRARRYDSNPMYDMNPRRRRRAKSRKHYAENRRHGRRRYRRNPDILGQLKSVFKIGAVIGVGFLAHRALSFVVSEKLLTQASIFTTGALADWRGVIGAALVAIAGVPLAAKASPKMAGELGAGIVVSFLHQTLVTVLKKFNQPVVAGYLAAYPDAEGVAFHSMRGYGAYELLPQSGYGAYELNPYSGMGAYQQAAAGFGQPIMQAAAGYGGQITQAAAGFGQPITQAAAGLGEYFASGVQGIGEYEAVQGYGTLGAMETTREGIHPNLMSAEHALSVAEAAAGVGDIPLQSEVNPQMIAAPVMDAPGGSRAGILEGSEGIFG